jgi:hypothetical protein
VAYFLVNILRDIGIELTAFFEISSPPENIQRDQPPASYC